MSTSERVRTFYTAQLGTWPALARAAAAVAAIPLRVLAVGGTKVVVQPNPARRASTTANVARATPEGHPCALCPDARPHAQGALAFAPGFDVLCNPAPILPTHVTIVGRAHEPQRLEAAVTPLLSAAAALGPGWLAFYNGPGAGASIPGHLHLQAGAAAPVPLVEEVATWPSRVVRRGPVEVRVLVGHRVGALVAHATRPDAVAAWVVSLGRVLPVPEAVDLLALHDGMAWTVVVVPRTRHRPRRYDAPEPARLTMSPGALDMAGFVPMPDAGQAARVTAADLAAVFAEVALDPEAAAALAARA